MYASARQRAQAYRQLGECFIGFAEQDLAQDLPVLGFGGPVMACRPNLETSHQLGVDVAHDRRLSHVV
jgi:hypothetical protein